MAKEMFVQNQYLERGVGMISRDDYSSCCHCTADINANVQASKVNRSFGRFSKIIFGLDLLRACEQGLNGNSYMLAFPFYESQIVVHLLCPWCFWTHFIFRLLPICLCPEAAVMFPEGSQLQWEKHSTFQGVSRPSHLSDWKWTGAEETQIRSSVSIKIWSSCI